MISLIFWILASISKAIADNLAHHFYKSIFNKLKPNKFWSIELSNRNPIYLPFTRYKLDAWHLFNSLMIICCACSIIFWKINVSKWWEYPAYLILAGWMWNLNFNLFYDHILNKRNKT